MKDDSRPLLLSKEDAVRLFRKAASSKGPLFLLRAPPEGSCFSASTILSQTLASVLEGWYGSEWTTIYVASRDGWRGEDFHSRCNGKGPTLTVIRTRSGSIFGGFLNESWRSDDSYIECTSASLFVLFNPSCSTEPTLFPVTDWRRAAQAHGAGWGPIFGAGDLAIGPQANGSESSYSDFPQCYDGLRASELSAKRQPRTKKVNMLTGARYFRVSEIEVYRLSTFRCA